MRGPFGLNLTKILRAAQPRESSEAAADALERAKQKRERRVERNRRLEH